MDQGKEGGEVDAWATGAEGQNLRASASKAPRHEKPRWISPPGGCAGTPREKRYARLQTSIFAQLQGSYAEHVKRFKSACLANDQVSTAGSRHSYRPRITKSRHMYQQSLHDKTMREAVTHFRPVKMAQMSHDRYQARLDKVSTALQNLIRPALV